MGYWSLGYLRKFGYREGRGDVPAFRLIGGLEITIKAAALAEISAIGKLGVISPIPD
jgi:hypothetical protein